MTDQLDELDRVFLESLNLAVGVILRLGEDSGVLNTVFESELFLFRDRVERALLGATEAGRAAPGTGAEPR